MRINTVTKARTDKGTCRGCGTEIKAGMAYQWVAAFRGPKTIKCTSCKFRDSELTSSKMSTVYAAVEGLCDFVATWDGDFADLESEVENAQSEIERVADEYDDANNAFLDNGGANPDLEEKAEMVREFADGFDLSSWGVDEFEGDRDADKNPVDQEAFEEWVQQVREEVESNSTNYPF